MDKIRELMPGLARPGPAEAAESRAAHGPAVGHALLEKGEGSLLQSPLGAPSLAGSG
jgi:hypothetical protein